MEGVKKFLRLPTKSIPLTERGELIDFFVREINIERQGTKYKPIAPRTVAIKIGYIPTKDLYALKSKMLDAQRRSFPVGVVFFSETKTDKI